jgi:hypothetical protein
MKPRTPLKTSPALEAERVRFAASVWPLSPGEGILAACRLSEDMRKMALAGLRVQHPNASESELHEHLNRFRLNWERSAPRLGHAPPSPPNEQ